MVKPPPFQPGQYELTDAEATVMTIIKQHNAMNQRINPHRLQQVTGYSPDLVQQATQSLRSKGLLLASSRPPRLIVTTQSALTPTPLPSGYRLHTSYSSCVL